eukprot:2713554-Prymnesium_polylepis.1
MLRSASTSLDAEQPIDRDEHEVRAMSLPRSASGESTANSASHTRCLLQAVAEKTCPVARIHTIPGNRLELKRNRSCRRSAWLGRR